MTETSKASQSDHRVFKQELFDDFKHLANCSQDAVYHYDIDSRRFLFKNQKFRFFSGWKIALKSPRRWMQAFI
jgi:hypothetical protein